MSVCYCKWRGVNEGKNIMSSVSYCDWKWRGEDRRRHHMRRRVGSAKHLSLNQLKVSVQAFRIRNSRTFGLKFTFQQDPCLLCMHIKFEQQYFRQKFVREIISQGKIVPPLRVFILW